MLNVTLSLESSCIGTDTKFSVKGREKGYCLISKTELDINEVCCTVRTGNNQEEVTQEDLSHLTIKMM